MENAMIPASSEPVEPDNTQINIRVFCNDGHKFNYTVRIIQEVDYLYEILSICRRIVTEGCIEDGETFKTYHSPYNIKSVEIPATIELSLRIKEKKK